MDEILDKIREINSEIKSEKTEGVLRLFALIERTDLESKWDIVFSSDWLKKTNDEDVLIYLLDKLKNKFNGELEFLARVVVVKPDDSFIQNLAKSIVDNNLDTRGEIKELKVLPDSTIKKINMIEFNFKNYSFNIPDNKVIKHEKF